jgi:short-subunit dehydrogenase
VKHRVVLITGASGGIGLATARALAGPDTQLFLAGRRPERLNAAAAALQAVPLLADLSDAADVAHMVEAVQHKAGHLDVLVNCAGQLEVGPAEQLGVAVAEQLIRVNYLGAIRVVHACLPLLRMGEQPVIVNVSSFAGRVAPPFMAAYAASKFALNGYSHALRQELRPEGIHVGLVLPGPVDTPMVHGRLGGVHYPVPPGVPTLSAVRVARAILAVITQRSPEVIVPWRLRAVGRLASAYPGLVDRLYARLQPAHIPPAARGSE